MRVNLGGYGTSIPELALPVSEVDAEGGFWLVMADGSEFHKQDWLDQGFTNFDVFCIGAAGGQGGGAVDSVRFITHTALEHMPDDVWAAHLTTGQIQDNKTTGQTNHVYTWGDGGLRTWSENEPVANPTHLANVSSYHTPFLIEAPNALGGAGGGGGIQKRSGRLTDLPDIVPVTTGAAGVDALYGQVKVNGVWTPSPFDPKFVAPAGYFIDPATGTDRSAEYNAANDVLYAWHTDDRYTGEHLSFTAPIDGGDGGASYFGELCVASGGLGGKPGKVWVDGVLTNGGQGGDGGVGGTDNAGGGAEGSTALPAKGSSGTWDGAVGNGGGGGHAGVFVIHPPTGFGGSPTTTITEASDGGIGAYAFDDTSVFGERGRASGYRVIARTYADASEGEIVTTTLLPPNDQKVVPGQGGGAKPAPNMAFGSLGGAGSPNGAVIIRVSVAE